MPCNSIVHLGPWGGEDGAHWSYTAKGSISGISVTSDDHVIRSISFTSGDGYRNSDKSPVFGTPMGPPKEINIDPRVEKLVLMEGIIGTYNSIETLTQLSFTTSKNGVTTKHGPYGSHVKGTEFLCPLSEDPFAGFYGHCGETLNSIGVMVRNGELVQSFGGEGGAPWSYTTKGTISHISISYGDVIRAIRFTSVDASGRLEHSNTFGDSDPKHEYHEIEIETTTEKLNGITGTYGNYGNMTVITSLAFTTTNLRTFGTFGTRIGTPFKYRVKDEEEVIAGFHGQAGSLIDAIGVYKRRSKESRNGVLVGPFGGTYGIKWTYQPKGLISRISLTYYDERIFSIRFESKDEHGNIDRSPVYGVELSDYKKYEINLDDAKVGKLNGISGTTGTWSYGLLVTSLCFSTDKKVTYGPFGNWGAGARFSATSKDGYFSGFHGNNLVGHSVLSSIGVYVSPTK